jgi:hypothetical protein
MNTWKTLKYSAGEGWRRLENIILTDRVKEEKVSQE